MKKVERKKTQPINVLRDDFLDLVYYAFKYALGRNTSATDLVIESIIKNWEAFEKFERDAFVRQIKYTIALGWIITMQEWHKWESVMLLHKNTTPELLESLFAIVQKNMKKK